MRFRWQLGQKYRVVHKYASHEQQVVPAGVAVNVRNTVVRVTACDEE